MLMSEEIHRAGGVGEETLELDVVIVFIISTIAREDPMLAGAGLPEATEGNCGVLPALLTHGYLTERVNFE